MARGVGRHAGLPKNFRKSDRLFEVGRVFILVDCLAFWNGAVVGVVDALGIVLAAGRTFLIGAAVAISGLASNLRRAFPFSCRINT